MSEQAGILFSVVLQHAASEKALANITDGASNTACWKGGASLYGSSSHCASQFWSCWHNSLRIGFMSSWILTRFIWRRKNISHIERESAWENCSLALSGSNDHMYQINGYKWHSRHDQSGRMLFVHSHVGPIAIGTARLGPTRNRQACGQAKVRRCSSTLVA